MKQSFDDEVWNKRMVGRMKQHSLYAGNLGGALQAQANRVQLLGVGITSSGAKDSVSQSARDSISFVTDNDHHARPAVWF